MEIYTEFVTTVLNALITIVITTLTMMLYHFRKINKLINDMFTEFNGNTASPTLDNAVKIAKVLDIDLNKLKVGD